MKTINYILLFTFTALNSFSQQITRKNVRALESEIVAKLDSNAFYMKRIAVNFIDSIIKTEGNIIIEFYQPWCGASELSSPKLNWLNDLAKDNHIKFCLISDAKYEDHYFLNSDKKMGRLTYYFNKYNINFQTYMVSKGEELDLYKMRLAEMVDSKV